jgi:hypothetical protein
MRHSLLSAGLLLTAAGSLSADQAKNPPPLTLKAPPPSFQVLHVSRITPTVDVLFQGDGTHASSHASATLTPVPNAKQHH